MSGVDETIESAENNGTELSLKELIPTNEIERLLVQLHGGEINSEEFLSALFNAPMFVLTTEDQIDKSNNKLKDNPRFFTLFGDKKQPYLALFSDNLRARPVQEKDEKFTVMIQVPVGDMLAQSPGIGLIVNPFWDKHARWEPEQIGIFGNLMRREEGGLWVRIPEEELMTVMTNTGYPLKISRDQFRSQILPEHIKQFNDKPDELYSTIMSAVNDGFGKDVLSAAHRLLEIDPIKERAVTALSMVLIQSNYLDEAEKLMVEYLGENRSPVILANMAKLHESRGDLEKRTQFLEESLQLDPNMSNVLEWYCAVIDQEKGGTDAVVEALDNLEGIAGSWRPAMLLGRAKLIAGKIDEALEHYTDALEVDGRASDALVLATAELGQSGNPETVITFGLSKYDIKKDDPRAGLNILQACVITKQKESGLKLAEEMSTIPHEELQKTIEQFKEELEKIEA